jgi:hypothetical protein
MVSELDRRSLGTAGWIPSLPKPRAATILVARERDRARPHDR